MTVILGILSHALQQEALTEFSRQKAVDRGQETIHLCFLSTAFCRKRYNLSMRFPVPGADASDVKWRLHYKMRPRVDFIRQALNLLDDSEVNIRKMMKSEVGKAEEAQGESVPSVILPPPISLKTLREQHLVVLPLNARYAGLISCAAGLEWLVHAMQSARLEDMAELAQNEAEQKDADGNADAARKFREMREVIEQDRRIRTGRVVETLRQMAAAANLPQKGAALQIFSDLCLARNAVVHCGGAAEDFNQPDKLRDAVRRLSGFEITKEVKIGKEPLAMPLGENQIWIERDALRPLVEKTLDFVLQARGKLFG